MDELLTPRHPLDAQHHAQLDCLAALPAEERAAQARLFRLGNAAYRYHQQAGDAVTEDDFQHWLAGLPANMRAAMERDGFAKSKAAWPLRRHALERRDQGYDAFVQALVSPEDWAYAQAVRQATGPLGNTAP